MFLNILFEFAGLFFLYMADPCESVRSLPWQTKDPGHSAGCTIVDWDKWQPRKNRALNAEEGFH